MFKLNAISLFQFKNYQEASFKFDRKIIGISGANGSGKTNLLDAIHYLCFTRSYFNTADSQLVSHGQQGFRISGSFLRNAQPATVTAVLRETGKKEFSYNEEVYAKMSQHIGRLTAVMIAPDDVAIITGASDERRKMIDVLLGQLNEEYLRQLMAYNKLLQQRNSLLKQMAEQRQQASDLLQVLDHQLATAGAFIYQSRAAFLDPFLKQVITHYKTIAQQDELVEITYASQLEQSGANSIIFFENLLKSQQSRDLALQRTTHGIHRDDLKITLNNQPFKQSASQGQRKSLLFALKLTEFEMLQQQKGFAPILLLDDVFEKLDNNRMTNLLFEVCKEKKGQVFITDTHRERLYEELSAIEADFEIIEIKTAEPQKI